MSALYTIECRQCEWAFDRVPMNDTTRRIIALHESRYSHTVIVSEVNR